MELFIPQGAKQNITDFLAGSMKFIILAFVLILILSFFLWGMGKQIDDMKNDLVAQGQLTTQVQQLKETTTRLEGELALLTKSNELNQQSVAELRAKNADVVKVTKERAVAVQKQITDLKLDNTLSPVALEKAISSVYASALQDNQCRLLPELCKTAKDKATATIQDSK